MYYCIYIMYAYGEKNNTKSLFSLSFLFTGEQIIHTCICIQTPRVFVSIYSCVYINVYVHIINTRRRRRRRPKTTTRVGSAVYVCVNTTRAVSVKQIRTNSYKG
uniref:Uncharacterized protein n=1 Tax=Sipha flava TaxID=143950 RepID=A0A2S2QC11_9HEMI